MILAAFDIADELRAFVNHNLRGLVDDFRVREDPHRLYHEIETVVFCEALRVEERPIFALGFHLIAAHGGYTFLHEFGFLDAPGFVDFRGVHRHLVGTCTDHVECAVFAGCPDIEVARHRQSFAFTVFGHFREEAGKLDVIACDRVRRKYFVTFDIGEVLAVGFIFDFKILCRDVADFAPIGDDVDFNGIILKLKILFGYVNGYAAEALVQYLIMNTAGVYGYSRTALRMRIYSKNECWDV